MSYRSAFAAIAASIALTACGSTGSGETHAQAPVHPGDSPAPSITMGQDEAQTEQIQKPWGPAPWTGAFAGSAVMLADTFRIEGPQGLLEHVVASSDNEFYERTLETTPQGLLQVIRRTSPDVPEIRVQVDAWTLAAFDRVSILERVVDSPVRVIASGDALWRDADGRLAKGARIECMGEIGDDTPAIPAGATAAIVPAADEAPDEATDEATDEADSTMDAAADMEAGVEADDAPSTDSGTDAGSAVEPAAEPTAGAAGTTSDQ